MAASEEHDLAAAEFAHAAQDTKNAEVRSSRMISQLRSTDAYVQALRTLHLLEEHHKKLGQILKFRHEHPQSYEKWESLEDAEEDKPEGKMSDPLPEDTSKQPTSPEVLQQPPRLAGGPRTTARDLSSSIASNLASARGIPGGQRRAAPASPTISAQHVPGKFATDQTRARGARDTPKSSKLQSGFFSSNDGSNGGTPSWAPPTNGTTDVPPISPPPAAESAASMNDAPFQQFYNTLESLMSKLSAPLAFAGLPLVSSANSTPEQDNPAKPKESPPPAVENQLDYSQMISKAALRAVQDGQLSSANPAESFYVVPTTGGTISYADIMTRPERDSPPILRHARHLSNLSEDNMEDFVDAKETLPPTAKPKFTDQRPHPAPPPSSRGGHIRPSSNQPTLHGKTLEELTLANNALKVMTDTLSKRLHTFEASAQSSSAALAYSIRSIAAHQPQSSPVTPENSQGKVPTRDEKAAARDEKAATRIAELEEIVRRSEKELTRRERENGKLKETVGRYREKWEKLKEGARARRGDGGGGGSAGKGEGESVASGSVE